MGDQQEMEKDGNTKKKEKTHSQKKREGKRLTSIGKRRALYVARWGARKMSMSGLLLLRSRAARERKEGEEEEGKGK